MAPQPASATLRYLDPATVVPAQLVGPPPAHGSLEETLELERLRGLIARTSPARMAQARADGEVEDPDIFSATLGRDLRTLRATWTLLAIIQHETDVVVDAGKDHFAWPRPWGVDPTIPHCTGRVPTRGYPSGHSGLGYSVGWTLAQLVPDKAPAILARADDYALSREICGVHFHADTEASHVIGTLVASRLLADPRLATQIAAAQQELSASPR